MSHDVLADFFCVLKNAMKARKDSATIPASRIKVDIAKILKDEGFIEDYKTFNNARKAHDLKVILKYHDDKPVISSIVRVSRTSRRAYATKDEIPKVRNGMGIAILTTSRGIMSDARARRLGVGGEIICTVY
jgi:small subunit ribosomal protein S8